MNKNSPQIWKSRLLPLAASATLAIVSAAFSGQGATSPLNLDDQPAFNLGESAGDPLFSPSSLGLTNGLAGFERAAAFSMFARDAVQTFAPAREVFVAYGGNPGYALLGGTAQAPAPLAANSPLSFAAAFQPGGGVALNVYPGRGWGCMYSEPIEASLAGNRFEMPAGMVAISPLVLDLNGDGVLSASRGEWQPHPTRLTGPYAAFDIDGDGCKEIMEWIGKGDGLLATTAAPTNGRDLLGAAGGWKDGFQHLAARYDLDHNGQVEGKELEGLYVWQDANTNGVADPGEVVTVQSLGITRIAASHIGNFVAEYRGVDGMSGTVWDWWPNCALANRRTAAPAGGATNRVGIEAMAAIRNVRFGRVVDDNSPPKSAAECQPVPCLVSAEQLAAAGVDLPSFSVALLADGGRMVIGFDRPPQTNAPLRVRLLKIRPGVKVDGQAEVTGMFLPFETLFQIACGPAGRSVLALGNQGSLLALVDFESQTVTSEDVMELRAIGLRASGLAGYAGGTYWFSAWQLDDQGAVMDERTWMLTPFGLVAGISLDQLRSEFGQLRSYFLTGADSGFFAVPAKGGTGEELWWLAGTNRVQVAQGDSFGGMHAIAGRVTFTLRKGANFSWSTWSQTGLVTHATASEPYFYPLLTDGGGTAIAAQLLPATGSFTYFVTPTAGPQPSQRLLTTHPGQGKITWGAFAHYGTNGITVMLLPEKFPEPPGRVWNYTVLTESRLVDECPVCLRLPIVASLSGAFQMRLLQQNSVFSTYAIENLLFSAGSTYKVTGGGLCMIGNQGQGQHVFLTTQIQDGVASHLCYFTNAAQADNRPWPMLQATLLQTNSTPVRAFTLRLAAAPMREIWFSTVQGFHAGIWDSSTNYVSPGDLISSAGRVVKRNSELTRRLGMMPMAPDLGLDAVDILPGGEIVFSTRDDAHSETLGALQNGDLLSAQGRVVRRNAVLLQAFMIPPPTLDVGLDAVQVMSSGEIYFSITTPVFSGIGRMLNRGDLLSDAGRVIKTNQELLARFQPEKPSQDYGLKAIYIWPSGEVWFAVEDGFQDKTLGAITNGDLLSDRGYIVYRNLDLLAAFQPLEDLNNFGLDALFVVSDAQPAPATGIAPSFRSVACQFDRQAGAFRFQWESPGRFFQVERATEVQGPYLPVTPIATDLLFEDIGAPTNQSRGFYRIMQW